MMPTQPSTRPSRADNHLGAATQQNLESAAAIAPDQTTASTVVLQAPLRLISATGV